MTTVLEECSAETFRVMIDRRVAGWITNTSKGWLAYDDDRETIRFETSKQAAQNAVEARWNIACRPTQGGDHMIDNTNSKSLGKEEALPSEAEKLQYECGLDDGQAGRPPSEASKTYLRGYVDGRRALLQTTIRRGRL